VLAGGQGAIYHVPAPFPEQLPAGEGRLGGDPAVVVLANRWFPNRDGAAWFVQAVWPEVRAQLPRAVLHLFGTVSGPRATPAVVVHRLLTDSAAAFPPGAILAVPLRIASGVRVKIMEAWARGVPVVATPVAVAGLEASHGKELLIAADPREFAQAIDRYHRDPPFARAMVASGRALLRGRHAPGRIGRALAEIYTEAARRAPADGRFSGAS
jgi:glycosyltransferase involved in cell wall biosynthesis